SMGRLGNEECSGHAPAPSPRAWWTSALLSGTLEAAPPGCPSHRDALSWSLTPEPGAAAVARDLCTGVLARWEMAIRAPDVELIVSELVTNALRHGRRTAAERDPIRLSMLRRGGELVCAVRDRSDRMPQRREP